MLFKSLEPSRSDVGDVDTIQKRNVARWTCESVSLGVSRELVRDLNVSEVAAVVGIVMSATFSTVDVCLGVVLVFDDPQVQGLSVHR